jgi:hypothetical protein
MNLIRQEELCGEVYGELWRELYEGLYGELDRKLYVGLYREVNWPLGLQIRTNFSHSKISRV